MFEGITNFFKRIGKKDQLEASSKDTAKERLHLVLMQDRANVSADFLDMMRKEIIEVIKKYIDVDENDIDVRLTNRTNEDGTTGAPALYANIPIAGIKEEAKNKKTEEKEEKTEEQKIEEKKVEKEAVEDKKVKDKEETKIDETEKKDETVEVEDTEKVEKTEKENSPENKVIKDNKVGTKKNNKKKNAGNNSQKKNGNSNKQGSKKVEPAKQQRN
jgi:cell division topological specificity factor